MSSHNWKWTRSDFLTQVLLESGKDLEFLPELDQKYFLALAMPISSVRFDARTLELLDTNHDGRIRAQEIIDAIEFLKKRGVDFDAVRKPPKDLNDKLLSLREKMSDIAKLPPSDEDAKSFAAWEEAGKAKEIQILGEETSKAEISLKEVEETIDKFFTPPEEMGLVSEEPDVVLPLRERLNPKFASKITAFATLCSPLLTNKESLTRNEWQKVKTAFEPYRAWVAKKPIMHSGIKEKLEEDEREILYTMHLMELLENFVSMKRLYSGEEAIFQVGVLRMDAKELKLCFHVENEAAHSALSGKSNCCVIYAKLSRLSENATRQICAVVTAGTVADLYVGRNGVFVDRDGKDWDAVITKVVENQVSLFEAFWAPWRKLGASIKNLATKFLSDKQSNGEKNMLSGVQNSQAGGAAMASSVAAIGIGVGMMGTAVAAIVASIRGMKIAEILLAICAILLVVSLPSVILTWFKLKKRDLGAILNASGWAMNCPLRFSMKRARTFTICAKNPLFMTTCVLFICFAIIVASAWYINTHI